MISKDEILEIFDKYNKDEITIATLGCHTSLHILKLGIPYVKSPPGRSDF